MFDKKITNIENCCNRS